MVVKVERRTIYRGVLFKLELERDVVYTLGEIKFESSTESIRAVNVKPAALVRNKTNLFEISESTLIVCETSFNQISAFLV